MKHQQKRLLIIWNAAQCELEVGMLHNVSWKLVTNYGTLLHKILEEQGPQMHNKGSPKSSRVWCPMVQERCTRP
jgi:hypothetical protein